MAPVLHSHFSVGITEICNELLGSGLLILVWGKMIENAYKFCISQCLRFNTYKHGDGANILGCV
jgi:hypothetical protein